jgi:hypothetical protein
MIRQAQRLLSATTEDEGIAAFEAHHRHSRARQLDEEVVDPSLVDVRTAGPFSCKDALRRRRSLVHELGRDEPVVEDRIAAPQRAQAPAGDEIRVAGAGSYQVDLPVHGGLTLAAFHCTNLPYA